MSKPKRATHTPGPWIPEKSEYGYWVRATDPTQKPVADVHLFCVDNREPKVWSHEETFANATLIAAAPELLDCLRRVFTEYGIPGLSPELNDQIVRTIAKAEGRES